MVEHPFTQLDKEAVTPIDTAEIEMAEHYLHQSREDQQTGSRNLGAPTTVSGPPQA